MNKILSGRLNEERREFIKKSGSLAVMSMFGIGFFTSCSKEDMSPDNNNPNPPNPDAIAITDANVKINLAMVGDLTKAGGWLLLQQINMLVINAGNGQYNALTSVCTHSGCTNNWAYTNEVLICTCHDSRFTKTGEVISGPASRALTTFAVNNSNGVLTITR